MTNKSGWIPVKQGLPPPGQWVLVWTGKYHWIAKISAVFGMWVGVYENEYWREPTHWMFLPSAPPATSEYAALEAAE